MRRDVGHGRREHIGPLLIDQTGVVALTARFFVDGASLLPLLYVAANHTIADVHDELVNGGVGGQRKYIQAFNPVVRRVGELLRNDHPRNIACDLRPETGTDAHGLDDGAVTRGLEQQAAGLRLARLHGKRNRPGEDQREQNEKTGPVGNPFPEGVLVDVGGRHRSAPGGGPGSISTGDSSVAQAGNMAGR